MSKTEKVSHKTVILLNDVELKSNNSTIAIESGNTITLPSKLAEELIADGDANPEAEDNSEISKYYALVKHAGEILYFEIADNLSIKHDNALSSSPKIIVNPQIDASKNTVKTDNTLFAPALSKVHYRNRNVVDHFGADPTGTVSSTKAFDEFQAALTGSQSGNSSGGGDLWVPSGRYLLEKSFVITNSYIYLRGDGEGITNLVGSDNLAGPVLQIGASDGGQAESFSPRERSIVFHHRNKGFTVTRQSKAMYAAMLASISGTSMNVRELSAGRLQIGMQLSSTDNRFKSCKIVSFGSADGSADGGTGHYTISTAQSWSGSLTGLSLPLGTLAIGSIIGVKLEISKIIGKSIGIVPGQTIDSGGVIGGTTIISQISGVSGGLGIYIIKTPGNVDQYVTPENMVIGGAIGIRWAYYNDGCDEHVQISDQFIGRRLDAVSGPNQGSLLLGSVDGNILNVSRLIAGHIFSGAQLFNGSTRIAAIAAFDTGSGGIGTYTLDASASISENTTLSTIGVAHEISIRYDAIKGNVKSCTNTYEWRGRVADVFVDNMEYGQNADDTYSPELGPIVLNDVAQQMRFHHCLFIPRGPNRMLDKFLDSMVTCLNWRGYPQAAGNYDGMLEFDACYSEGINYGITTDHLTILAGGIVFVGGDYGFSNDAMNINPKTNMQDIKFDATTQNGPFNIQQAKEVQVVGNTFRNGISVYGEINSDCDVTLVGNTLEGAISFSGSFVSRTIVGNTAKNATWQDTAIVPAGKDRISGNTWVLPDSIIPNGKYFFQIADNQGKPGLSLWIGGDNKAHLSVADENSVMSDVLTVQVKSSAREAYFQSSIKTGHITISNIFNVNNIPHPAQLKNSIILISDYKASGVAPFAYSDGVHWRFLSNNEIVS